MVCICRGNDDDFLSTKLLSTEDVLSGQLVNVAIKAQSNVLPSRLFSYMLPLYLISGRRHVEVTKIFFPALIFRHEDTFMLGNYVSV